MALSCASAVAPRNPSKRWSAVGEYARGMPARLRPSSTEPGRIESIEVIYHLVRASRDDQAGRGHEGDGLGAAGHAVGARKAPPKR